ncbi:glycosyl hydrolase family 43 [Lactococcus hodotermopsidis]|uniref:Glycosyl hydrolase family 43 n=1 Tax=Pseudolactococcus hodotermopsidis TaxID=2709157 RepID=A0A6A0BA60_9LACT|nr:glycoside hydrolase family 43 protein [Lactococcus hodotermopsidis]GFH41523.1 glycosyl hydrolase family 43 [Lactococcus hodotermopsidis]
MKLKDINIRDPFVLPYENVYYMYGTRAYNCWSQPDDLSTLGFDVYESTDLENWSEPTEIFRYRDGFWGDQDFWAPEVHVYQQKFYMFATFIGKDFNRGTMVLVADSPTGPFTPHSDGALTPKEWMCLDGTFYLDKAGQPWLVFCHEWQQITDGTICRVRLSADLRQTIGTPETLFAASSPKWAPKNAKRYVTDGPYLYRLSNDELIMFWSSLVGESYLEAIAISDNQDITGNFTNHDDLFFSDDGGHGMVFKTFDDKLMFTLHQPNEREKEHPVFFEISEKELQ